MKGFDDKCLLLFLSLERYDEKAYGWTTKFKECVHKLVSYLHSVDINVHMLYEDDVARIVGSYADEFVTTLSKADRFFTSRHCNNMSNATKLSFIEFPEVYAAVARKDMVGTDATEIERFNMVMRHHNSAAKSIIPTYKIVIHIGPKTKGQYKLKSVDGDSKILIQIDDSTLMPTCYMSGEEVSATDLLGIPYGNRSLYSWEV